MSTLSPSHFNSCKGATFHYIRWPHLSGTQGWGSLWSEVEKSSTAAENVVKRIYWKQWFLQPACRPDVLYSHVQCHCRNENAACWVMAFSWMVIAFLFVHVLPWTLQLEYIMLQSVTINKLHLPGGLPDWPHEPQQATVHQKEEKKQVPNLFTLSLLNNSFNSHCVRPARMVLILF